MLMRTKAGFENPSDSHDCRSVRIPVIASGGGGKLEHIYEVLTEGHADAALVASMLHYGDSRSENQGVLMGRGIKVRIPKGRSMNIYE